MARMHQHLAEAFDETLRLAQTRFQAQDYTGAFALLERAHVLGQSFFWPHWRVHGWMLRVGLAQRNRREVLGQLWRLALTPLGHISGRLPIGNTGRANISAFQPLPIAPELQRLLDGRP